VIGPGDNPVLVLKKSEVPGLFSPIFWNIFEIWKLFHYGFGTPDGRPWGEYDPDLVNAVMAMEAHYQNNFSLDYAMFQYQEAILKTLKAIGGFKK
jgi:hypothetical protein